MGRKFVGLTLITFLLLAIFTTGCKKEVENLMVATVFGGDLVNENGIDKYTLWARFMDPSSKGIQGNQESVSNSFELLISGSGDTSLEMTTNVVERLHRMPFYGHGSINIYGARLAQGGILSNLELTITNPDMRPDLLMFVTKGQASQIIKLQPLSTSTLSKQITEQTERTALNSGLACGVTISEFSEWMLSPDRDALMPEIEQSPSIKGETVPPSVIVQGFGVFRGAKLVGWLDKDESTGYLLITKKLSGVRIPISFTKDNKSLVYFLIGSKSKIEYTLKENKPSFKIKIQALGLVYETDTFELTPEQIEPVEQIIADKIRNYPVKTIAKAKEYKSDFLGLMEKFHRYNPVAWQEIAPNWRDTFHEAVIEVEVTAKILGRGFLSKSWIAKP